jgi:glycosyltransferase involved in cell wall biosynthesis
VKRILVVLEAGDRLKSGLVRGVAYKELLEEYFDVHFENRRPLRTIDQINNLPRGLNKAFRLTLKDPVLSRATEKNEQRILRLAQDVNAVYLLNVKSRFIVALSRQTQARLIYDVPDPYWLVRGKDVKAFYEAVRAVDAVTTENELMANHLRQFNPNCYVVPEAPPLEKFDFQRDEKKRSTNTIVIGWIGSPAKAFNLYVVWEALEQLFQRFANIHLRLVGTGSNLNLIPEFAKDRFSCVPIYDERTMIDEVLAMDIGIYPLQDVATSRMRSPLKGKIYMCGAAAVVASRVGAGVDLIQDGVNGMLAGSTDEWIDKLESLITDADLRRRLVDSGLETIRSKFTLERSFANLRAVLDQDEPTERMRVTH